MCKTVFDGNMRQQLLSGCAIKCQQLILRDFGIDVAEERLAEIASSNGWFDPIVGMFMRDNGKLLGCFGIAYRHSQHHTVGSIILELHAGHDVMVNINRQKLYGGETPYRDACHSVLLTDCDQSSICIIDPADGAANRELHISDFLRAWEDSENYMLSTTETRKFYYNTSLRKYLSYKK